MEKILLSRVRHGLWSIRERCSSWPFSSHIPFLINNYLFPFHLEKNLNFQRYSFLIGIRDVCRIPRIYLNAKINFITSLRLLFYSESMRESSLYIKYSMPQHRSAPRTSYALLEDLGGQVVLRDFNTHHLSLFSRTRDYRQRHEENHLMGRITVCRSRLETLILLFAYLPWANPPLRISPFWASISFFMWCGPPSPVTTLGSDHLPHNHLVLQSCPVLTAEGSFWHELQQGWLGGIYCR